MPADRLLGAIAACTEGVRPTTLEHALGVQPGALRTATDALEVSGVVVFLSGRLSMLSEEQRASALAALGHAELAALHGALAEAVGRSSYEPGIAELERAMHESQAGMTDVAAGRLERVARSALRGADATLAMRALDARALLADDVPMPPEMIELRARAAVEVGDSRTAELWKASAAALAAGDDPTRAARSIVGWYWALPDDAEARAALTQLATGDGGGPHAAGWQAYARSVMEIMAGDWHGAIAPLETALGHARDAEDAALEVAVLGSLATARSYLGQLDLAADLLRRCVPLAFAEGDAVAARRVRHNLVEVLVEALRTDEAADEAARCAGDAEHRGAPAWAPGAIALHARVLAIAGHGNEARAEAERALLLDRALPSHQRDIYVDMVAADLLSMEGLTPRFQSYLAGLEDRVREFGFDSYLEAISEIRFRAAATSGDLATVIASTPSLDGIEPVTAATLALVTARLLAEFPDQTALRSTCEQLAGAIDESAAAIPLVELCTREVRAVLDGDRDALADVAAMWEEAERPIDGLLARRACLLLGEDAKRGIESARVAASLEAAGLLVLAQRDAGAEAPSSLANEAEQGAPARLHPGEAQLLAGLPAAERAIVLDALSEHVVEPGDASPPPRGVCIVGAGEIRLQRIEPRTTDRQLVVAALGAGDVFGHESLLPSADDALQGQRIEAASTSVIWVLPAVRLADAMAAAPRFAAALLADATARLAEARLLAGESALLPVETRLARTLVRLGERFGRPSLRGDLLLDMSLTHADIANMIGSQRARVSGLMSALQKQGILDTWKRRIIVLDLTELRRRSGIEDAAPTANEPGA